MIGLDTNVLIRYIALDDPIQTPKAERVIDSLTAQNQGFVSLVVLAEISWVLRTSYRYKKIEIVSVIQALLSSRELVVEQRELVADALRRFAASEADFDDFLIERSGHTAGCAYTCTFDQRAANATGMRLLK
ncbi:MAG: PIN domain-containing protein [Candidatus Sulfotelmatobacter sp.]